MKLSSRVLRTVISDFVVGRSATSAGVLLPPAVQGGVQFGFAGLDALVGDDQRLQICLGHPGEKSR